MTYPTVGDRVTSMEGLALTLERRASVAEAHPDDDALILLRDPRGPHWQRCPHCGCENSGFEGRPPWHTDKCPQRRKLSDNCWWARRVDTQETVLLWLWGPDLGNTSIHRLDPHYRRHKDVDPYVSRR